jgi:hypothetical protein
MEISRFYCVRERDHRHILALVAPRGYLSHTYILHYTLSFPNTMRHDSLPTPQGAHSYLLCGRHYLSSCIPSRYSHPLPSRIAGNRFREGIHVLCRHTTGHPHVLHNLPLLLRWCHGSKHSFPRLICSPKIALNTFFVKCDP